MSHDPHDQPTTDPENRRAAVRARTESGVTRTAILLGEPSQATESPTSTELDLVRADGARTYLARVAVQLHANGDLTVRVMDTARRYRVIRTMECQHEASVDLAYPKE